MVIRVDFMLGVVLAITFFSGRKSFNMMMLMAAFFPFIVYRYKYTIYYKREV